MARYRIVHWKEIPSLVEAADGDQTAREQLSQKFQDLIDALAMRENATEEDAYLEGWGQGEWLERPGSAGEVPQCGAEFLVEEHVERIEGGALAACCFQAPEARG